MLETREGGCHCGRVRFRAEVDLDRLSHCSCSVCTKKGILHLGTDPATFQLLRGKNALTSYTFGTGVAQHTFCSQCGMHAFYIPRSQPHRIIVNARCLDDIDGPEPDAQAVLRRPPLGGCATSPHRGVRRGAATRRARREDPAGDARPGVGVGRLSKVIHPPQTRAIAFGKSRRLDRGPQGRAERPFLTDKQPIVAKRSLRSALRAPVETTGIATCDRAAPSDGGGE